MNSSKIIWILILLIFNNSLIHCFFISNPFNWFRRTPTKLAQNQTLSSLEPTDSNKSDEITTEGIEHLFKPPLNQIRPIEPLVPLASPDRPIDSLTLSQLGIPLKVNRFGLEALPYPMKTSHSKLPRINLENDNSLLSHVLQRRIGDSIQTSTQMTSKYETDADIEEELNTTQDNYSTQTSTENSTPDMTAKELEEDHEYFITGPDSDTEKNEPEEVSPTPVYRPTTAAAPDREDTTLSDTTPKPTFLHQEEFANLLNDMYYRQSKEVFDPMMDKFNERALK